MMSCQICWLAVRNLNSQGIISVILNSVVTLAQTPMLLLRFPSLGVLKTFNSIPVTRTIVQERKEESDIEVNNQPSEA